jgi:hypothetical protein
LLAVRASAMISAKVAYWVHAKPPLT